MAKTPKSPRRKPAKVKPKSAAAKAKAKKAKSAKAKPAAEQPTQPMPTQPPVATASGSRGGVMAAAALALVALMVGAVALWGNDDTAEPQATAEQPASKTSKLVSTESGSGFDMDACKEVTVKRIDTGETVKKTVSFCEAQAKMAEVDPEKYFAESPHYRSDHENGRVIKDGLKDLTPEEQLQKVFRLSAKHPSVAASVIGCYAPGAYTQEKLDELATGEPGGNLHKMAFVDIHDILTDEDTTFTDITLKDEPAYNEGRAPDGTRTATPQSVSGDATQVGTGMNTLPSGGTAAPHTSKQLDRCDNCITSAPEGGVVTPSPGVIPPSGGGEQPGQEPVTPPSGGGEAPGTETVVTPTPEPGPTPTPTPNKPKGSAVNATGTEKYQPPSETQPPSSKAGNEGSSTVGVTEPNKPAPVPDAGPVSVPTPTETEKADPTGKEDGWAD